MEYFYNYRIGSIVNKKGFIEPLTIDDLVTYNKYPVHFTDFTPIKLTEKVLLAYGFQKNRLKGNIFTYRKYYILLEKKRESFFCVSTQPNLVIQYLHELQDLCNINTFLGFPIIQREVMDFIRNYGSRSI